MRHKGNIRLQRIDIKSARFKSYRRMLGEIQNKYDEDKYEVRAYVVGQEGRSSPSVMNSYNRILMWGKKAISSLSSAINVGTQFILGHSGENSGRTPVVGKVIASFVENLSGKFSAIVIGVFERSKMKNYENNGNYGKLDFASIESKVTVENPLPSEYSFNELDVVHEVDEVSVVSKIALGSLKEDSPAFPGAVLLHAIHCFSPSDEDDDSIDDDYIDDSNNDSDEEEFEDMANEGTGSLLTMDKLRAGIRDLNVRPEQVFSDNELVTAVRNEVKVNPSDLFTFTQIEEDKSFTELATLKENAGKVGDLDKQVKKLETEKKEADSKLLTTTEKIRLGSLLDKAQKKGTLDKKQREYIINKYEGVADAEDPMSEEDMQTFVATQKKQYIKDAAFFGIDPSKKTDTDKTDDTDTDKTDETDTDTDETDTDTDKDKNVAGNEAQVALDYFLQ